LNSGNRALESPDAQSKRSFGSSGNRVLGSPDAQSKISSRRSLRNSMTVSSISLRRDRVGVSDGGGHSWPWGHSSPGISGSTLLWGSRDRSGVSSTCSGPIRPSGGTSSSDRSLAGHGRQSLSKRNLSSDLAWSSQACGLRLSLGGSPVSRLWWRSHNQSPCGGGIRQNESGHPGPDGQSGQWPRRGCSSAIGY